MERLDRAIATQEWKMIFPINHVTHLPRYKSNHAPIVLNYFRVNEGTQRSKVFSKFRFEHMWMQHPEFENTLKETWRTTTITAHIGEKLQQVGMSVQRWASKHYGSVRKKRKKMMEKIAELQKREHTQEIAYPIRQVEVDFDAILKAEETMWFQHSRALL